MKVAHYTMDGTVTEGDLIIHHDVAKDVEQAFKIAFDSKFPIEKMRPIHVYNGSDLKSVEDNNTSAFNCRPITGRKRGFSKHSYGRAIDINPLINPYVKRRKVIPAAGKRYLNRARPRPGMLFRNSPMTQYFLKRGWKWGGNWRRVKDYQHFEFNPKRRRYN
jgi:hypothetical protein